MESVDGVSSLFIRSASSVEFSPTSLRLDALVNMRFRAALFYFYFVLGVSVTMPMLPVKQMLMDDLKVQPADMAIMLSWVSTPWIVKPLYGFISDSYPIAGLRRRPYLLIGLALNAFFWLLVSAIGPKLGLGGLTVCLFAASLTLVIADVSADSLVVENAKLETQAESGKLQSGVWMSRGIGSMVAAAFSGIALEYFRASAAQLLALTAAISGTGLVSVAFSHEDKFTDERKGLWESIVQLFAFWKRPEIHRTCLFVLLFAGTPSAGDAYFYFMRNQLGFGMGFLGALNVFKYASSAAGALFYRQHLRQTRFRNLLAWSIVWACLLGMTTIIVVQRWNQLIGLPDEAFAIGDTIALAACAEIALMPIVVLAARLAPVGAEGTVYASIISVSNLSGIVSESSGGWITSSLGVTRDDYSNLWKLILICNLSTLLPLPFIHLVPDLKPNATEYQHVGKAYRGQEQGQLLELARTCTREMDFDDGFDGFESLSASSKRDTSISCGDDSDKEADPPLQRLDKS